MVYNYKELLKKYKKRYIINKLLREKKIYKVEFDVYSENLYVNPLVLYSKRYSFGIITLQSALFYYNFTDVIPDVVFLATYDKAHTIKNKNIKQIFIEKDKLYQGMIVENTVDGPINIYDKERLLLEFLKRRNKFSFEYYKEVINNYREISEQIDMYKIEKYLSIYKNGEKLLDIINREVF